METFSREIFEQLGSLYYAMATEQDTPLLISGELKMAIKKDWLTGSGPGTSTNVSEAAHLMGVAIDSLQSEQVPASVAFDNFEKFYRKHEEQFSGELKKQILETADTVMRILPPAVKENECYRRLKDLLHVPAASENA